MITIPEVVAEIIQKSPFLEEAMQDEIINFSGLARYIQPQIEKRLMKNVKEGAIVMALKRYPLSAPVHRNQRIRDFVANMGDIVVRSSLIDYTFKNSDSIDYCQQKFIEAVAEDDEAFYTVTKGVYETNLVASKSIRNDVKRAFYEEKLIGETKDLASITIKLPKGNIDVPGIYYYLFKELAIKDISIVEVISTTNEITLVINDKDVDFAFTTLKRL